MFMCCCCCSTQRAHSPDPQAQEPLSPWTEVLLARFNTTSVPQTRVPPQSELITRTGREPRGTDPQARITWSWTEV